MFVRWSNLTLSEDEQRRLPGYRDEAIVRPFDAPEALETRFYEVRARSVLNRVPDASRMPFRWTINPYRGCAHARIYCFARPTHRYLDFDAGRDFEREIVVKVNAPEVLRAELARPSWKGEHVALGTNTDPYQWVEGRYRLMQGIWEAFRDAAGGAGYPCSVLTKSPLLLRDLPVCSKLRSAPRSARVCDPDARRAPGGHRAAHAEIHAARLEAVADSTVVASSQVPARQRRSRDSRQVPFHVSRPPRFCPRRGRCEPTCPPTTRATWRWHGCWTAHFSRRTGR